MPEKKFCTFSKHIEFIKLSAASRRSGDNLPGPPLEDGPYRIDRPPFIDLDIKKKTMVQEILSGIRYSVFHLQWHKRLCTNRSVSLMALQLQKISPLDIQVTRPFDRKGQGPSKSTLINLIEQGNSQMAACRSAPTQRDFLPTSLR